jgi:hypothetical protein
MVIHDQLIKKVNFLALVLPVFLLEKPKLIPIELTAVGLSLLIVMLNDLTNWINFIIDQLSIHSFNMLKMINIYE